MKKKLDWILGISILVYGFFLLWQYFNSYPSYGLIFDSNSIFSKNFSSIIVSFLLFLLVTIGVMFWQKTKITLAKIFLFLWLGLTGYLLLFGVLQPQDVFANQNFFLILLKLLLIFGVMFGGSIIFTLILIVVGKITLTKIQKESFKQQSLTNIFLYFFLGFFVFSFLGFFLAKIGFFIFPVFVGFFVFILIFFWNDFKELLNKFYFRKVRLDVWQVLVISLVLSVVILNFSQIFFPFSIGWDSSNHYLLTTKSLIEDGFLRGGIFPPFVEIIMAIFGKFVGLSGVQFLFIFWGSFLPFTFYMVNKHFKLKESLNIMLSLSLFVLPAISFQLSKDIKLDVIYLQLLLIILVYFRKRISLLLLGCAPLIKLTAFWFFPVVFFMQFIGFSKKKIKTILISILLLILPFSIWGTVNLINYGSVPKGIVQWQNVLLKGKDVQPEIKTSKLLSIKQNLIVSLEPIKSTKLKYLSTAFKEEVGRYSGNQSNLFKKIWAIFTSPNIPRANKQYIDLGFLWILFLPFWVFSFYEGIRKRNEIFLFSFLAVGFFIPWIFMAEGIAWYGLPFLILLFIISGKILTQYKKLKITNLVIIFFIFISIFMGIFGRLAHSGMNQILTSLSWASTPTTENANRLSNIYFDEERKVANILNNDSEAIILRIGTLVKFWLSSPDSRVVEDPQLDIWSKLTYGQPEEKILDILKNNKIKYLLIDRGTISIETNQKGTLHKKFTDLQNFVLSSQKNNKTDTLFFGKRIILIRLSM